MYNENTYNSTVYNVEGQGVTPATQGDIVYNGLELQSDILVLSSTSFDSGHNLESDYYNKPLTNGIGELSYFFRQKEIVLKGYIKAENAEELNNEIDRLKKIILQNNKNLDIKVNGTIRRAKSSCINPSSLMMREYYHINFIPIELVFRASELFKEITQQNLTLTGKTTGFTEVVYHGGSGIALPEVILTFSSASSTNTVVVNIGEKTITVGENISTSDILKINSDTKQVLLNDVEIDYLGEFPELVADSNSVIVTVNGTVDYDFSLLYYNTYL